MSDFHEKRVKCKNCGVLLVVHMRPPGSSGFFPTQDQEITCVECRVTFCVGEGFPFPIVSVQKELPSTKGFKPNNGSSEVKPSVLAPFPPPAGDMVPEPPKGEWVAAPATPEVRRSIKGQNVKRTGQKRTEIVIKNSARQTTRLKKPKPKPARTKRPRHKR